LNINANSTYFLPEFYSGSIASYKLKHLTNNISNYNTGNITCPDVIVQDLFGNSTNLKVNDDNYCWLEPFL